MKICIYTSILGLNSFELWQWLDGRKKISCCSVLTFLGVKLPVERRGLGISKNLDLARGPLLLHGPVIWVCERSGGELKKRCSVHGFQSDSFWQGPPIQGGSYPPALGPGDHLGADKNSWRKRWLENYYNKNFCVSSTFNLIFLRLLHFEVCIWHAIVQTVHWHTYESDVCVDKSLYVEYWNKWNSNRSYDTAFGMEKVGVTVTTLSCS